MNRIISILFLIAMLVAFSYVPVFAQADGEDGGDPEPGWQISAGGFQGVSTDGESITIADVIVDNPDGDVPVLFGFFPTKAWYRHIQTDDNAMDLTRFDYALGSSDDFSLAFFNDGHDSATGIRYTGKHWNVPLLDSIDVTAMIREGGKYLAIADFNYEFLDGYGIEGHGYLYLDESFDKEKLRGEVLAWHNMIPDGSIRLKAGYVKYFDEDMIVVGAWGTF